MTHVQMYFEVVLSVYKRLSAAACARNVQALEPLHMSRISWFCLFLYFQVLHAQMANYVGVIVVNYKNENLIVMGGQDSKCWLVKSFPSLNKSFKKSMGSRHIVCSALLPLSMLRHCFRLHYTVRFLSPICFKQE